MTSSVDLFPPRRPLFFPVVIATVFLTIIGMTAGYMLGERHRRHTSASQQPGQTPGTTTVASTVPSAPADGAVCPDAAQQAAAAASGSGDLRQVLKIVTDNRTTVWICQDPQGALFYQSHTIVKGQDLPLQQNFNGLFLPGVTRTAAGFEVYDQKKDHFEITRQHLQISFVNGKVQLNDVTQAEG